MIPEVRSDHRIDRLQEQDILLASGKSGIGIEEILEAWTRRIPSPTGDPESATPGIDL